MKKYTSPFANVVLLETADVISSSGFVLLSWSDFMAKSDVDDGSGL